MSTEDSFAAFVGGLRERYNVVDVTRAPFIKTRSPGATACIVNFCDTNLPYSIYIPGERCDSRVYPFHNKPMLCSKCQEYGHTQKYCRATDGICRRCASGGHVVADCSAETPLCHHCKEPHPAGSRTCSRQIRESTLLRLQEEHKVSLRRAVQLERGETVSAMAAIPVHPDIFDICLSETDEKTTSPWLVEKCISSELGGPPSCIRSVNSTTFAVTVASPTQGQILRQMTSLPLSSHYSVSEFEGHLPEGIGLHL